ncbi:hypothetical protein HK096_005023, partial [Nowakowskiella sp. JEL0078]
ISEQSAQAEALGFDGHMDVSAFAEYRKIAKSAEENFFIGANSMLDFWRLLSSRAYKPEDIEKISMEFMESFKKSEDAYRILLDRFPNSRIILRSYAKFCFEIVGDQFLGQNLLDHAELLEESKSGKEMKFRRKTIDFSNSPNFSNQNEEKDQVKFVETNGIDKIKNTSQNSLSENRAQHGFVESAIQAANTPFVLWGNISNNNAFRYVADNYVHVQTEVNDYAMNELLFRECTVQNRNSIQLIIILSVVHALIVFTFAGILHVFTSKLRGSQAEWISVFKEIKSSDVAEMLDNAESLAEENEFSKSISNEIIGVKESRVKTMWMTFFRLEYFFYCLAASALSSIMAYITISRIYDIEQRFTIVDRCGDMRTYNTRVFCAAKEFFDFSENQMTWNNDKSLLENHLLSQVEYVFQKDGVLQALTFGDNTIFPITPSYDNFPESVYGTFVGERCFLSNLTLCSQRQFNYNIGYTPELVNRGLFHFATNYVGVETTLANQLRMNEENFFPSEITIKFLEIALEPDLVDGFENCEKIIVNETKNLLLMYTSQNQWIFIAEIGAIFLGKIFILLRAIR